MSYQWSSLTISFSHLGDTNPKQSHPEAPCCVLQPHHLGPSFMTVPGQRTPGWCEAFQTWYSNWIFKKPKKNTVSKLQNEDVTYVTGALLRFLFGKSVSRWFLIASCSLPGEISRPPGASATLAFHVSGPRRCSGDRGATFMGNSWENDGKMMMLQPWEHLQIGDLPFSQHRETADVAAKNMGKTCGCVKKSECYS